MRHRRSILALLLLLALSGVASAATFTLSTDCTAVARQVITAAKWNSCLAGIATGINAIDNDRVSATAAIVGSKLDLATGTGRIAQSATLTSDLKMLDTAVTWNNGAVTFTGWKLNVTNTSSGGLSKLIDLQLGGSSRFAIDRLGYTTIVASSSKLGAAPVTSITAFSSSTDLNLVGVLNGYGSTFGGTAVTTDTAGSHDVVASMLINPPTKTAGTATVTNAAALYLSAVPTLAATGNYTLWAVGLLRYDGPTSATVGAAGGAAALPATPVGYVEINIGGTGYLFPAYAKP